MEEFTVPEDVGDVSALQVAVAGRFCASEDLPSLRDETSERLNDLLDGVGTRLKDGGADSLSEQGNFDDMFSLIRDFKYLPSEIKGRALDILHGVLQRTTPLLGGDGAEGAEGGNGRRSARGARRGGGGGGAGEEAEGQLQPQGQAELSLRNAFKMAVYLLFSAAFPSEECYSSAKQTEVLSQPTKGKGSRGGKGKKSSSTSSSSSGAAAGGGSFKWEDARESVLESMRLALTAEPSRLWQQGVPDRCFMSLFLRLACKMLELPETAKSARQGPLAMQLISEPFHVAHGMETEFSAAVFLLVRENKHLAEFVAKLCRHLVDKHGDARLGAELVREIGRMHMPENSKNTAASAPVVNVSEFLRVLVVLLPGTVYAHESVLLPHLSSSPYQIRQAVVTSLAEVLLAAHEDQVEAAAAAGGEGGGTAGNAAGESGEEGENQPAQVQVQLDPRRARMNNSNRRTHFNHLVERAMDVSPFVRNAVLRSWGSIAKRGALPRMHFLVAAKLGADRLRDQSSLVRKDAAKLLAILLEYNPYDLTLDLDVNERRCAQAEAELRAMGPPSPPAPLGHEEGVAGSEEGETKGSDDDGERKDEGDGNSDSGSDKDDEDDSGDESREGDGGEREAMLDENEEGKEAEVGAGGGDDEFAGDNSKSTEAATERAMKEAQCDHLRAAVLFIKELEVARVRLEGMLGSTTISDVVEALRFFVTACHFKLPGAIEAIKKSLTLIWRTEESIESEIKQAFVKVFVQPAMGDGEDGSREGLGAQIVARNLVSLVNGSQAGELASLEEVVSSLVKDTMGPDKESALDLEVFEQLWCAVGVKGQRPKERAGALHAIAMGSSADPSLVNGVQRLEMMRETALGRATMETRDWRTVRCACIALLRCDPAMVGRSKEVELILSRLSLFLQGKWCLPLTEDAGHEERAAAEEEMKDWFAGAEQALAVVFHLSNAPEAMGAAIVRRIALDTLSSDQTSPLVLARLCFVLGHLALKLLVYAEDLAGNLERARARVKPPTKGDKSGGSPGGGSQDEDDATAQELGLTAEASAEDEQRLTELVEKEIVGRNLLGAFGPLLVRIVADEGGKFGHPLVRQSSVLALSKFMCISETFCDRNLSLLFTTLERAKDVAVRANIIVALGDLAFRFPNALEPWNRLIYKRLQDNSPLVRSNAIMVLTHLILNDMVKVKGQVSGLAVCMVDKEPRIQDAAKVFFHKYSERGNNPVYNVLPDIVGRLSKDEQLAPAEYRQIMDFLMQYVKKDKLTELLAEKLCARLASSETPRQSRAVSYCLGQLKVTEKAVSRLAEEVPNYKHKLQDKEVHSNFMAVVSRAKRLATPEMSSAVAEWEAQLLKYHQGGAEDEDAAARASRAGRKRGGKRSSGARASTSTSSKSDGGKAGKEGEGRPSEGGDGVGEEQPDERTTSKAKTKKASAKTARASSKSSGRKAKKTVLSSDSESVEEESEEEQSDDDDDDDNDESDDAEDTIGEEEEDEDEDEEEEDAVETGKAKKGSSSAGGRSRSSRNSKTTPKEKKSAGSGRTKKRTAKEEQREEEVDDEDEEEEEEEGTWGSEEDDFEKKPKVRVKTVVKSAKSAKAPAKAKGPSKASATKAEVVVTAKKSRVSKENRVAGKTTPTTQRPRRSRNASPLSPKN